MCISESSRCVDAFVRMYSPTLWSPGWVKAAGDR